VLALALAACGGGKAAQQPTTPASQPAAAAPRPQPGDEPSYSDIQPEAQPATNPPAPEPPPSGPAIAGPKPPTLDLPPDKRAAMVQEQLRKAEQALKARDADGAVRAARAALDADESNIPAMIRLAHGYYLKGYDDKVEAVLTIAKRQREGDQSPILWMLLGLTYDRENREDDALAAYEKATSLRPDYIAALHNKGTIHLKRKRYADAVGVFERLVSLQSQSPRAHTYLGAAYRGRSADDPQNRDALLRKSEQELKLAQTINPAYAPAFFNLGILYLDADPFPGLDGLPRMQNAQKYLAEYKQKAGPGGVAIVDDYLAAAQKGIEREQKALERKKKKDAQAQKKKAGEK
jgi:tetratricopeptide (TPR) repeat protein